MCVGFNLHMFGKQTGRQNILDRMVAGVKSAPNIFVKATSMAWFVPKYTNFATISKFHYLLCKIKTNYMRQNAGLLTQHVSSIIMTIFRSIIVSTAFWGPNL
jgi:hypothetical protein